MTLKRTSLKSATPRGHIFTMLTPMLSLTALVREIRPQQHRLRCEPLVSWLTMLGGAGTWEYV